MTMLIKALVMSLAIKVVVVQRPRTTTTSPEPTRSMTPTKKKFESPSASTDEPTTTGTSTTPYQYLFVSTLSGDPPEYKATRPKDDADFMAKPDRIIICDMIKELLMDAHLKAHKLLPLIDAHRPAMAFEVGNVIGIIRERYRRMMTIYREYLDKEHIPGKWARTYILPPGIEQMRTIFALIVYEQMHEIEWDIEKMIEIIEDIPREALGLNESTIKPPVTKRATMQGPAPPNSRRSNRELERYKSRLREQFLLRRLGMDERLSTTKKRFLHGWPVEDTWDNIQY